MRPILAYLRNLGVVPTPPPTPGTPVEEALERYRIYLTVERGLRRKTGHAYVDAVRPFLQGRIVPSGVVLDLRNLAAADVIAFVVARCPRQSPGEAKMTVTALRSRVSGVVSTHCHARPKRQYATSGSDRFAYMFSRSFKI
jgi:integrase/recombinase XerD